MARARRGILLATALALVVSGCSSVSSPDESLTLQASETGASPSPRATGTMPSTPGVDAEDAGDPSTWVVSIGRIGPIELGGDFAETLDGFSSDWQNPSECASVAYWSSSDASYLVSFEQDESGAIVEASVEWLGETTGIGPRTDDGLGVGATPDEVTAARPDATAEQAAVSGMTLLRIDDDDPEDGALFFEYREGTDGAVTVTATTREKPSDERCG